MRGGKWRKQLWWLCRFSASTLLLCGALCYFCRRAARTTSRARRKRYIVDFIVMTGIILIGWCWMCMYAGCTIFHVVGGWNLMRPKRLRLENFCLVQLQLNFNSSAFQPKIVNKVGHKASMLLTQFNQQTINIIVVRVSHSHSDWIKWINASPLCSPASPRYEPIGGNKKKFTEPTTGCLLSRCWCYFCVLDNLCIIIIKTKINLI